VCGAWGGLGPPQARLVLGVPPLHAPPEPRGAPWDARPLCLGSTALDPDAGAFRTGIAPAPLGPWVLTPPRGDRDRPREVPQGRGVGAAVRRGVSGQGGVPRPS